jgi:hypothetical protein
MADAGDTPSLAAIQESATSLSEVAVAVATPPNAGATESWTYSTAAEHPDAFWAASTAAAWMDVAAFCATGIAIPAASSAAVTVAAGAPVQGAPAKTWTVVPAGAVPETVTTSEVPGDGSAIASPVGAAGGVESSTNVTPAEQADVALPFAAVARKTVVESSPTATGIPPASCVAVPVAAGVPVHAVFAYTRTVVPSGAAPTTSGRFSFAGEAGAV